jgi:hypothetical protein
MKIITFATKQSWKKCLTALEGSYKTHKKLIYAVIQKSRKKTEEWCRIIDD